MKSDYTFDDDVTQAASFVSPQQTAVSTENSDLLTCCLHLFLSYCFPASCVGLVDVFDPLLETL